MGPGIQVPVLGVHRVRHRHLSNLGSKPRRGEKGGDEESFEVVVIDLKVYPGYASVR